MERIIDVEGRKMRLKSTALLPKQYRYHFGCDLISDMSQALAKRGKKLTELDEQTATIDDIDMDVFERLAWLMLRAGGEEVGNSPDEWLDTLDSPMTIYTICADVAELWAGGQKTTSTPKKK